MANIVQAHRRGIALRSFARGVFCTGVLLTAGLLPLPADAQSGQTGAVPPPLHLDELEWRPGDTHTIGDKYLSPSDPGAITETLTISSPADPKQRVVLGFDEFGGGYLWSAKLFGFTGFPEGFEAGRKGFGRGMLGAIRDQLHSGRYNPTQSGYNDLTGVHTEVASRSGAVLVPQFAVALYSDGSLGKERMHIADAHSEFDTSVITNDVSAGCGLPAFVQKAYWAFARPADAIRQFSSGVIGNGPAAGKAIVDDAKRIVDISPGTDGDQTPGDSDLSFIAQVPMGLRPPADRFPFLFYRSAGKWVVEHLSTARHGAASLARCGLPPGENIFRTAPARKPINFNPSPNCRLDVPMFILGSDADPAKGTGVGLYVPQDDAWNAQQTVAVDVKTLTPLKLEDRRIAGLFQVAKYVKGTASGDGGFFLVQMIDYVSGLLSPASARLAYGRDTVEMLRQKTYVFFGSPEAILAASRSGSCRG